MDIKDAIEVLDKLHSNVLLGNNAEEYDTRVFARQHLLKGLAEIESAKASLELAEMFFARETNGLF